MIPRAVIEAGRAERDALLDRAAEVLTQAAGRATFTMRDQLKAGEILKAEGSKMFMNECNALLTELRARAG